MTYPTGNCTNDKLKSNPKIHEEGVTKNLKHFIHFRLSFTLPSQALAMWLNALKI